MLHLDLLELFTNILLRYYCLFIGLIIWRNWSFFRAGYIASHGIWWWWDRFWFI